MRIRQVLAVLFVVALLGGAVAHAATITIVNVDGPGEGFNDLTPATPVGGNTGTTIGEQRLIAFQAAADYWGSLIESDVEIKVDAEFNPLYCDSSSAVLGSCGSNQVFRNFPNAPVAGTWYCGALANSLAGYDLSPASSDMHARFNSSLGGVGCGYTWWYGIDDSFPGTPDSLTNLFVVLMHEMGHGLGFQNFVDESTGQLQGGYPDIFSTFTLDVSTGLHWDEMDNTQRVASAINTNQVVLDGPDTKAASDDFVRALEVDLDVATGPAAGSYAGRQAIFGAGWPDVEPVSGQMELVNDGTGTPTFGCQPLVGFTPGNIAVIDRGTCEFGAKALNAETAGASAAIIANDRDGTVLVNMAGGAVGDQVTIPVIAITQNDGSTIKPNLPVAGEFNIAQLDGIHPSNGMALLYAPNPVELGSSISHWVIETWPNSLMEPNINADLTGYPDMALGLLQDEGWTLAGANVIFDDDFESGDTSGWSSVSP